MAKGYSQVAWNKDKIFVSFSNNVERQICYLYKVKKYGAYDIINELDLKCCPGTLYKYMRKKLKIKIRNKVQVMEILSKEDASRYTSRKGGRGKIGFRNDLGHNCRSTWEANFSRILRYLKLKYLYEPFYLKVDNISYLPDFYIPSQNLIVEIKGYENIIFDFKWNKIRSKFKKEYKFLLINSNSYFKFKKYFKSKINNWEEDCLPETTSRHSLISTEM